MKIMITVCVFFIVSCAGGKEKTYTGSTPAAPVIRSFLGISMNDSIDFIRWKIILRDNQYELHCNYGIGKPNTNGFINGGKKTDLSGQLRKEKNYYHLQNGNKTLRLAELNGDLLHLLNADNSLLIGNGGWSFTLNNMAPSGTDAILITAKQSILNDSIGFEGRTPCKVPGVIAEGRECYKLKWYIVLYANAQKGPGTYRILGTAWRQEGGKTGNWKIITGKNERLIYQLNDDKGNGFLYLLKLDEHVVAFTDAQGKLLVGDEDFSYTLNRR